MKRSGRILVAEADDSLRETVIELLAASGHVPAGAHTTNAMERVIVESLERREPFELLLCDLELPGSCALEVLERLGLARVRPRTVALTARADDALLVEVYRIGCLCVLPKPLDVRELLRTVAMLERGAGPG